MSDDFRDPAMGISKVYTRTGDRGDTALVGGQRVAKDDARIEAYGTVDELNAIVGWCRAEITAGTATASADAGAPPAADANAGGLSDLDAALARVQHQLFNLGSVLATLPEDIGAQQPRVRAEDIAWLEREMDQATARLEPLRSFVLPGGSRLNAALHLARTVCRRAERIVVGLHRAGGAGEVEVQYLNRLSDAFFVWARLAALRLGHDEVKWDPNRA